MQFDVFSMYFRCIFDVYLMTKNAPKNDPKIGQKSFKNRSKSFNNRSKICPKNYIELHRNARKSNSLATKKACVQRYQIKFDSGCSMKLVLTHSFFAFRARSMAVELEAQLALQPKRKRHIRSDVKSELVYCRNAAL